MREHRLGDVIDDFCVRCKRVMNHNIVSVIDAQPAKVRCRTCHSDHDYRHEQAPPPKVDPRKAALFEEVLKKVDPDGAGSTDGAGSAEGAEEAERAEAAEATAVADPPKPKTKGKAKK